MYSAQSLKSFNQFDGVLYSIHGHMTKVVAEHHNDSALVPMHLGIFAILFTNSDTELMQLFCRVLS